MSLAWLYRMDGRRRDQRQGTLPRGSGGSSAYKGDESQALGISSEDERRGGYKRNFKGKIDGA